MLVSLLFLKNIVSLGSMRKFGNKTLGRDLIELKVIVLNLYELLSLNKTKTKKQQLSTV